MIPDLDIYRAAKLLIDQRGDGAALNAAGRADLLLDEGDAVWRLILKAIEKLQRENDRALRWTGLRQDQRVLCEPGPTVEYALSAAAAV